MGCILLKNRYNLTTMKRFLAGILFLSLFIANSAFASSCDLDDCPADPDTGERPRIESCCPSEGLVPCGTTCCPCQLCDIFVMIDKILDFFFLSLIPPLAILLTVIAGAYFLLAGSNPAQMEKGKEVLKSVVIGLIIIYGAWLFISFFLTMIGVASWTGLESWFEINCP